MADPLECRRRAHLKGDGAQSAGKVPLLSLLRLYGMDESYMRRFGPQNRRRRTKGELEEGRKLGGTDGGETAPLTLWVRVAHCGDDML